MEFNKPYKSHGYVYFFLAKLKEYVVYGQFKIEETKQNKHLDDQRVSTISIEDWKESFDKLELAKGSYVRELNDLRKKAENISVSNESNS